MWIFYIIVYSMWIDLFSNSVLWATLTSWLIAQGIKIFFNIFKERKFDFYWIIRTGGMPSAHASSVSCLSVSIGLHQGFSSVIFAFSVIFALIVMFDAQTWRRSIGTQAKILNNILGDIYAGRKVPEEKVKEFFGHTPVEVFIGAVLGVLIGVIFY
jgi:uncharacterized protein